MRRVVYWSVVFGGALASRALVPHSPWYNWLESSAMLVAAAWAATFIRENWKCSG